MKIPRTVAALTLGIALLTPATSAAASGSTPASVAVTLPMAPYTGGH